MQQRRMPILAARVNGSAGDIFDAYFGLCPECESAMAGRRSAATIGAIVHATG